MSRQGNTRERTLKNIRNFWESEAQEWGEQPQVTIRDHNFRIHELHTLLSLIPKSNLMLDIGCGTGFGTLVLSLRAHTTVGCDFSKEMIRWGKRLIADNLYRNRIVNTFSPLWNIEINSNHNVLSPENK